MKLKWPTSFSTFQMSVVGFKSTKVRHSQHHLYLDETVLSYYYQIFVFVYVLFHL